MIGTHLQFMHRILNTFDCEKVIDAFIVFCSILNLFKCNIYFSFPEDNSFDYHC